MKRSIIVVGILAAVIAGGVYYFTRGDGAQANTTAANGGRGGNQGGGPPGGGPPGGGGFGGGFPGGGFPGGFGGQRQPMTVEMATVKRAKMSDQITVVGNLIGAA